MDEKIIDRAVRAARRHAARRAAGRRFARRELSARRADRMEILTIWRRFRWAECA